MTNKDEYQRLKTRYKLLWDEVRVYYRQGKNWYHVPYGLWTDYVKAHWEFITYRNKLYDEL